MFILALCMLFSTATCMGKNHTHSSHAKISCNPDHASVTVAANQQFTITLPELKAAEYTSWKLAECPASLRAYSLDKQYYLPLISDNTWMRTMSVTFSADCPSPDNKPYRLTFQAQSKQNDSVKHFTVKVYVR